jgi:hypothetical protein
VLLARTLAGHTFNGGDVRTLLLPVGAIQAAGRVRTLRSLNGGGQCVWRLKSERVQANVIDLRPIEPKR